jgi:hypothetical protein
MITVAFTPTRSVERATWSIRDDIRTPPAASPRTRSGKPAWRLNADDHGGVHAHEERGTSDDVGVEGLEPPTSAL